MENISTTLDSFFIGVVPKRLRIQKRSCLIWNISMVVMNVRHQDWI